jgi:hypothetical protein
MTNKNTTAFKAELKALLTKYDVSLGVEADGCSDWQGITGIQFAVDDNNRPYKGHVLSNELYIDASYL